MQNWRKYPKTELHRHLEGSVRISTLLDVVHEAGVKTYPDESVFRQKAIVNRPQKSLAEVLERFWFVQQFMATQPIIERIAYENVLDAYNDGVRHLELRYSPGYIIANHPKLSFESIHEAVQKGVLRAKKDLKENIKVGLIGIISRDQPFKEAEATADLVINHKQDFVGFDLAGPEVGFDLAPFEKLFSKVKSAGLGITVHAGEAPRPEAPEIVREAIDRLGATRIGHGLQIMHSKEMMDYVRNKNVVLELCPTSNLITQSIKSYSEHPILKFLRNDILVTLNSDDPHQFGIDLTHEYQLLSSWGASQADFDKLNTIALNASFIK
jgi:adenosine deaminase